MILRQKNNNKNKYPEHFKHKLPRCPIKMWRLQEVQKIWSYIFSYSSRSFIFSWFEFQGWLIHKPKYHLKWDPCSFLGSASKLTFRGDPCTKAQSFYQKLFSQIIILSEVFFTKIIIIVDMGDKWMIIDIFNMPKISIVVIFGFFYWTTYCGTFFIKM